MATPAQKSALSTILKTGSTEGVKQITLDAIYNRGWIHPDMNDGGRLVLSKTGRRIAEGKAGGSFAPVKKSELRAHLRDKKRPKVKKIKGATVAARREYLKEKKADFDQAERIRGRIMGRILGPTGRASAVKISRADGKPFKASDVESFRLAGWEVLAAGTVAGRVGAGGIPGVVFSPDDWEFKNPDTLGPSGMARALILAGPVDRETVDRLAFDGFDVSAAPKRLREAVNRNPTPAAQKKVYEAMRKAADKRQALRVDELAGKVKLDEGTVAEAVAGLIRAGLAHVAGRDLFGECFLPGVPATGLFANPAPGARAIKKAAAWYQKESLVTGAETIRLPATVEAVKIGKIVSITYESDKYDGRKRLWKHDVTGDRDLHISTDGKVLVVLPGFKVTKRGIEG